MTSIWLWLETMSPCEVCKIRFQNSPAPSSLLLGWETPVISPGPEDGTLGFLFYRTSQTVFKWWSPEVILRNGKVFSLPKKSLPAGGTDTPQLGLTLGMLLLSPGPGDWLPLLFQPLSWMMSGLCSRTRRDTTRWTRLSLAWERRHRH